MAKHQPASAFPAAPIKKAPDSQTHPLAPKTATPQQDDATTEAAKPKRKASSVNWDVDVLDGLRAAAHHLPHIPESGLRSLSDIVNTAAREKVAELESTYNNGKPFPRVGRLSAGRKP